MSFKQTAGKGGGDFERAPAGNHPAVLVAIIDLGTQHNEYQGKASWRREVLLVWELPTKKTAAGKSHLMSAAVTLSLNEKATLRKWIDGMTGKKMADGTEFDITAVLGKTCLLNVLHNDKGYPRVEAVAGYPDGLPAPTATLAPTAVSLEEFEAGKAIPEWVPWLYSRSLEKMVSPADHVRNCKEIAGEGPPRSAPATEPAEAGKAGDPIPF